MNDSGDSYERLIRDTAAFLEYAALAGVDLLPVTEVTPLAGGLEPTECKACPLREARQGLFEGLGGSHPKMAFVSDVPPPSASKPGNAPYSPFTGIEGELLEKIIDSTKKKAGLGEADIHLLFATRCIPSQGLGPGPLKEAIGACAPLLRDRIFELSPRVIIAMGKGALRALMGEEGQLPPMGGSLDLQGMRIFFTHGIDGLAMDDDKKTLRKAAWTHIQKAVRSINR